MKYSIILLSSIILLFNCVNGPEINVNNPSENEPENAKKITQSNYTNILDENDIVLIEFYSGMCDLCQKLTWVIDSLAIKYRDSVFVGANNSDYDSLWNEFGIKNVPTYVLFINNEKVSELDNINDSTSVYDTLSSLLDSAIAGKLKPDTSDTTESNDTISYDYPHLNHLTFDSTVLSHGTVAMVFFLNVLGTECIQMMPVIEDVAKHYNGKAVIASFNLENRSDWYSDIFTRYNITHLPEYRFFKDSTEIESMRIRGIQKYEDLESIIDSLLESE